MNARSEPAPLLLSPESDTVDGSAITDDDRRTYGILANLTYGHETHRRIAARVVWLDRKQLDFQTVVYAARDRIMHLAVHVDELESRARKEWIRVQDRLPAVNERGHSAQVLVVYADGAQQVTHFVTFGAHVIWLGRDETPTHWQPKPSSPEQS